MKAELIDIMGDDLRVVNAARVSFDKEADWELGQECCGKGSIYGCCGDADMVKVLGEKDVKLLSYLAKHGHWTPFSHVMITMRETVPIFVARQRFKHMVGFTYNEVSRRYVDTPPEFWRPELFRERAENKKQGSKDTFISSTHPHYWYDEAIKACKKAYDAILAAGGCPEQARAILPQAMMTSYYVTGSLAAWARAYKLRIDPHAQKEIQDLAIQWEDIIGGIKELEYSWKALTSE